MKFKLLIILLCILMFVSGCGGGETPKTEEEGKEEVFKVGFIYSGPLADGGWNQAHDAGRQFLESEIPDVRTTFIENVPEGADAVRVLTELVEAGNKVIFAASFGYMEFVLEVAKKYPDVIFANCAHFKTADNVGVYYGRMYEPRYLSGLIAGKMTKTNILGYVASHPIPEVIRGINAFALGAREVNPDVVIKVVWTNSWYDPAREKDAANSLLEGGADIIAQNVDTPAAMQAAEEKGAYGIGNNADMSPFAPKAVLTTPIFHWGKYYSLAVKQVRDGTWQDNKNYWGGMKDGIVDLAPYGPMVPQEVIDLVEARKAEIIEGKFHPFSGPIYNQQGELVIGEGEVLSDEVLVGFDWYVQGIEGSIN